MTGKLTTHVLDIARGCPACGMNIELWSIEPRIDTKTLLQKLFTNADGRTDIPLLDAEEFKIGVYEIVFSVGDYFAVNINNLPDPPFLDRVPIQFGIADLDLHYHVPLLVSPWSYSTYGGS
jgi:5-hydroxyisourate hydrolase